MATQGWLFGASRALAPNSARFPITGMAAAHPSATLAPSRRPVRIILLTLAIAVMSLADLQITLTFLRSSGMGEANPIARYVMEHGSVGLLVVWKCASISFACLVFLIHRNRRSSEIACWTCCTVLVWLLLRWISYSDEAWRLTPALHLLAEAEAAQWVQLRD